MKRDFFSISSINTPTETTLRNNTVLLDQGQSLLAAKLMTTFHGIKTDPSFNAEVCQRDTSFAT